MNLPILCLLAFIGVTLAAPRPSMEEDPDLSTALEDIARRKKALPHPNKPYSSYMPLSGSHRPYSSYQPLSRARRYRYPLYRKRNSPLDDEELPPFGNEEVSSTIFRERKSMMEERKRSEAHIEDDDDDDDLSAQKDKKESVYNLVRSPYDLHAMGRLYELGKRQEENEEEEEYSEYPSEIKRFYDAVEEYEKEKRQNTMDKRQEEENEERSDRLRGFLRAAANRYLRLHEENEDFQGRGDPMIRKKRGAPAEALEKKSSNSSSVREGEVPEVTRILPSGLEVPGREEVGEDWDRKKRAFNDYFRWERKKKSEEPQKRRSGNDFNDFLTREYFKSIARSVGNKRKRMAYGQFEAKKKRDYDVDELLADPQTLHYMQQKLKETEGNIAKEAEEILQSGSLAKPGEEELLAEAIGRLDAVERMREALEQLEELEDIEEGEEEEEDKEKRKKKKKREDERFSPEKKRTESNEKRNEKEEKRSTVEKKRNAVEEEKRNEMEEKRRKRQKGGEAAVFLNNNREECPVLDRVIMNCLGISEIVADTDKLFLDICTKHEVCYQCGAGMGITGHECDAIFSAALERACERKLECLGAAGHAFDLLSDPERYDDEGTCSNEECIREFMESR